MAVWRCRVRGAVEGVVYLAMMVSLPVGGNGGDAFMKRRIRLLKLLPCLSPDSVGAEAILDILLQERKTSCCAATLLHGSSSPPCSSGLSHCRGHCRNGVFLCHLQVYSDKLVSLLAITFIKDRPTFSVRAPHVSITATMNWRLTSYSDQ